VTIKAGNPGNVESWASPCATFDPTTNGLDFWESLEGMRVQVNAAVAVGPRSDFTSNREIPVVGDGFGASLRTPRGGIIIADDGNDYNPERIILNDLITGTTVLPVVNVGAALGNITGVIDYSFGNFKLQVTAPTTITPSGGVTPETTTVTRTPNGLTIATFNVENLSPVGTGSPATVQAKFDRLALIIVGNLGSPDIITLEEIQDNGGGCASDTSRTPAGCDDATVAADTTIAQFIAAIQNADGGYLGGIGLRTDWQALVFEIGYWLRSTVTGHGYISEAVRLLARFTFEELGANRLMIRCDARNDRSRHVPERLGFPLEARLRNDALDPAGQPRDTLVFALIPEDYARLSPGWPQD